MKSNILFVNPPSEFLIDSQVFLPRGLASVAAVARRDGHYVELLDLAGATGEISAPVIERIRNSSFDVLGITATSPQFHSAYHILRKVKEASPQTQVIIGGPHASMFETLRRRILNRMPSSGRNKAELEKMLAEEDINFSTLAEFDKVIGGEEDGLSLALKSKKKWIDGGIVENLSTLPPPALDLFDVDSYLFNSLGNYKFTIGGRPAGSIMSQRGCPFSCKFCCGRDSRMYHTVRNYPLEKVLGEMEEMRNQYGIEAFMFYDDEFNLDSKRTLDICNALVGRDFFLRGFIRSDLLVKNPRIAKAMSRAGFKEVLCGIESGSEEILKRIGKGTTPEINSQAAEILLDAGIGLKALTMLGYPGETLEDVEKTRDWILKTGRRFQEALGPWSYTFDVTLFGPYPGSIIWDEAVRDEGPLADEFPFVFYEGSHDRSTALYFKKPNFSRESGFFKGKPGDYKAYMRTESIDSKTYVELRDNLEREVRKELCLPSLILSSPSASVEHSMGQTG